MTQTTPSTSAQGPNARRIADLLDENAECYSENAMDRAFLGNSEELAALVVEYLALTASPSPAASPASPSGVRVKPLEWQENKTARERECKSWLADTPFGTIWIEHKKKFWISSDGVGRWRIYHETLNHAKAAAQADYEARILSALSSSAAPAVEQYRWRFRDGSGDWSGWFDCPPPCDGDDIEIEMRTLYAHPAPATAEMRGETVAGRVTLFSALEAAYIRGAAWCAEMGMTHTFGELRKAAYDYADKEEKDVICREVRAATHPPAETGASVGVKDLEDAILSCEKGQTIYDVLANYRAVRRTIQDLRSALASEGRTDG